MNSMLRPLSSFAIVLLLAACLAAEDQPATKKGKKAKKAPPTPAAFKLPKGVELTAEQTTKFDELKAQYATKFADAQKKVTAVFTKEQLVARQAAVKEAKAAGKKHKDLKAAVDAAVEISAEQKQQLTLAESELHQLRKEIRKQIAGLLTVEQRQVLKANKKQS